MINHNTQKLFDRAKERAEQLKRPICEDILLAAFFPVFNLSVAELIGKLGVSEEQLAIEADGVLAKKRTCRKNIGEFSNNAKTIIEEAKVIANEAGEPLLPMHIFTSLGCFLPKAMEILNISLDDIVKGHVCFNKDLADENIKEADFEVPQFSMFTPNGVLDQFAENLNVRAQLGEFDGIVDYDDKCAEMLTILSKGQKPNPILVGKSGVGKSSLVYALARQIVRGEVPDLLANTVIYSLSLSSLVAGTEYRGQFEKRLEDFINEVKKYDNVVLFIDEIHTLVGAGNTKDDSLEASNILKPDLASGKIKCIGATTINEYNNTIKKDSALDRRFQKIIVREPSTEEMRSILPTIIEFFEGEHHVKFTDKFQEEILKLCDRKLVNRVYPDKVIDVIDHCGAAKKVEHFHISDQITEKRLAILGDGDDLPEDKIQEFCLAAAKIEEQLLVTPEVTCKYLHDYFDKQTSPLYKLASNGAFVSNLKESVLAQQCAISEFVKHIKINSFGFNNSSGLPDSYIFEGSNGAGKTLLCKTLKEELTTHGANVIFLDGRSVSEWDILSNYNNHKNTVAEQVLMHPQSIILIDDYDKMTEGSNLIQRILATGQLISNGDRVDFANCQIIATSNAGETRQSLGFNPDLSVSEGGSDFQKVILFKELSRESLFEMIKKQFTTLSSHLKDRDFHVFIEDKEIHAFVEKAYKSNNRGLYVQKLFSNTILGWIANQIDLGRNGVELKSKDIK